MTAQGRLLGKFAAPESGRSQSPQPDTHHQIKSTNTLFISIRSRNRVQSMGTARYALNVMALMMVLPVVAAEPAYPNRLLRIIVPLAPGGGTDNLTRIM